jgi:hypothetical protein
MACQPYAPAALYSPETLLFLYLYIYISILYCLPMYCMKKEHNMKAYGDCCVSHIIQHKPTGRTLHLKICSANIFTFDSYRSIHFILWKKQNPTRRLPPPPKKITGHCKTNCNITKFKLRGLSLRASYTDQANAACRRSWKT